MRAYSGNPIGDEQGKYTSPFLRHPDLHADTAFFEIDSEDLAVGHNIFKHLFNKFDNNNDGHFDVEELKFFINSNFQEQMSDQEATQPNPNLLLRYFKRR